MAVPSAATLPWVVLIGIAGLTAHFCLTTALSIAPASIVMPMDFARLPAIAVVGVLFYDEALAWGVLAGAVLIFAGNYINILGARRSAASRRAYGRIATHLWPRTRSGEELPEGRIDLTRPGPSSLVNITRPVGVWRTHMCSLTARTGIRAAATLLATTTIAQAGGVERNPQTTALLFEEGTYLEFAYTYSEPNVSGVQVVPAGAFSPVGSRSGNVAPSFSYSSLGFRSDISSELSFAILIDEPIGANVEYAANGFGGFGFNPGYLYSQGVGSEAELTSQQLTLAARYELPNGFSVYGGLRSISFEGEVSLFSGSAGNPRSPANYGLDAEASTELGYMLGAAYEQPHIALRVALTYFSETNHEVSATETTVLGTRPTEFETTIPQQVLLEAQTGVAEGTLVFGSVRWTDWTEFEIAPEDYINIVSGGRALVDYEEDVWTWSIGGARVLTDQWTLLGSLTYEAEQDVFSGNLGPTDGRTSLGLGVRFTEGPWRVTAGVNYSWIGDAETEAPNPFPPGTQFSSFTDNDALSAGIRVGYTF